MTQLNNDIEFNFWRHMSKSLWHPTTNEFRDQICDKLEKLNE